MRVMLALSLLMVSAYSLAQSTHAYKSVNPDGTVSYSDTRPATGEAVKEVAIPQTSDDIEQQGEQRLQKLDATAKEREKKRNDDAEAKRKYESLIAEARKEVSDAERNLAAMQQSKKNSTPEQIELAREHLRLARKHLRDVQSAGP